MIRPEQIPDEAADVLAKIGFCSSYAAKSALAAALNAWPNMTTEPEGIFLPRTLPLSKEPRT